MHLFSEILWNILFPLVGLYTVVLLYIDNRHNLYKYSEFWSKHRKMFKTTVVILWYVSAIAGIAVVEINIAKAREEVRENTKIDYEVPCAVGDIIVFGIREGYDVLSIKGEKSIELIEKHRAIIKVSENTPNEMEVVIRIKKKQ